jgi:hypothetical protein
MSGGTRRCRALLLVSALAACTPEPAPTGRLLFPAHRMLDAPPAAAPAEIAWNAYVRVAGEERPSIAATLAGGEVIVASRSETASGRWALPPPAALSDAAWVLVRPALRSADGGLTPLPGRFVARGTDPPVVVDAGEAGARADVAVLALVTAVPALEAYDVAGAPFVVPPHAVASVGLAVDETAWSADGVPVELRVAVVDGARETIVHRTVLDPSRRTEDRRWVDARVDLAAFAGRTVRLALGCAPADTRRPGTSLPVWSDPVVLAPRATHGPNVVLISLDTLRARSVGAYGSPRPTTPSLDRMIGDAGTVFDFAYTTAPHTLPAHLSTFTGLFVRGLGGVNPISPLSSDVPTLPERLRAAGYETAAVTEDGFVVPRVGFRRGFASYRENTSPTLHEPLGQSAKTFRDAADWLAARRDRPTFLFVHTYEVHFPYTPAPPYDAAFATAADVHDEHALEQLRYEQEARHLDDELRAFLEAIDGLGLGTRTLVVVMADHGEEFGEHGSTRHGFQLYDESLRVPLMMRLPGVVPAGRRVATPVSLVDVAPTILDLVGAAPLVGVDGLSLVPLFVGGGLPPHRRAVFSEAASGLRAGLDLVSVQMPGIHCIYRTSQGTSQCFDTVRDPEQRAPLRDGDPRVDDARAQAVTYRSLRRAAPAVTAPDELVRELEKDADVERLRKLRALGYAE